MSKEKRINGYMKIALGVVHTDFSYEQKDEILKRVEKTVSREWSDGSINYKENRLVVECIFNCRTEILKQKAALRYSA